MFHGGFLSRWSAQKSTVSCFFGLEKGYRLLSPIGISIFSVFSSFNSRFFFSEYDATSCLDSVRYILLIISQKAKA